MAEDMQNTMFSANEASGGPKANFNKLVVKAKQLAREGYVSKALELNKKALLLFNNEKLVRRINKMEVFLRDYDEGSDGISEGETENHSMVNMGDGFFLYKHLLDKLYDYQREGVLWMWGLYKKHKGGILGDDMGLGKTIQVIAFLSGMFDAGKIKNVMIVLPVAVIINWEREFKKWAPGVQLEHYHGGSKSERARLLRKVQRRGGVLLTSYGMLVNHAKELAEVDGKEFVWDYVILDEGHKIKNPSNKCSKGVQAVSAKQRLILSGTPVMNNLKEMWALFDWTHQGTLLGRAKTFAMEYETPITKARQKDATAGEMRLGQEMAESLQKLISPYFLRRTKADMGDGPDVPKFTRKNDLVCWVFLSDIQQKIYEGFLNTPAVKELLNSTKSPLVALTVLKKICDHPRLLNNGQCIQLGLPVDKEVMTGGRLTPDLASECAAVHIDNIKTQDLVTESGKLVFLIKLVDRLKTEGHRCLIFSQSLKVLDIITKILDERGHSIIRLDGSIRQLAERERIIEKFTNDTSINVFLLTTQVGGVGLTITAANRVIIYDPSWNPATDAQAVDRAFRIGQEKDVVVYRLITCGSVEEKIYRRQIFKSSITKQATGESENPFRYFSKQELFELFVLDNPKMSVTQLQLQELHGGQETTDSSLDAHIAFLHTLEMFGISHHNEMFTTDAVPPSADDNSATKGGDYITGRVAKAQQQLTTECRENKELARQMGRYPGSEAADQPPKVVKGKKRSASSRLTPPTANGQSWRHEDISIVHPCPEDTDHHVSSRLPASAGGFGDTHEEVIDLCQIPSDTEDNLETTMGRLDISQASEDVAPDKNDVAPTSGSLAAETPSPTNPDPIPIRLTTPVLPPSGGRQRQLSVTNTPASAPRRRSRKSLRYSASPAANVSVTMERLVFSPRCEEPVVAARCHQSNLNDITSTLDYDMFSQHLNLNSTEMPRKQDRDVVSATIVEESPDVTANHSRPREASMECSVVADSEDEADQQEVTTGQCERSVCESPVMVTKTKSRRRRVLESSDEEDEESGNEAENTEDRVNDDTESNEDHSEDESESNEDHSEDEAVSNEDRSEDEAVSNEDRSEDEAVSNEDRSEDDEDPSFDEDSLVDVEDSEVSESDDDEYLEVDESKEEDKKEGGTEHQEGIEDQCGVGVDGDERPRKEGEEERVEEDKSEEEDDDSEQEEEEELSAEEQQNYLRFMMKSKELKASGDLRGALRYAVKGLEIYSGDEGAKKYATKLMKKLEAKSGGPG